MLPFVQHDALFYAQLLPAALKLGSEPSVRPGSKQRSISLASLLTPRVTTPRKMARYALPDKRCFYAFLNSFADYKRPKFKPKIKTMPSTIKIKYVSTEPVCTLRSSWPPARVTRPTPLAMGSMMPFSTNL